MKSLAGCALFAALTAAAIAGNCQLPSLDGRWIDDSNGLEVEIATNLPASQGLLGGISLGAPTVRASYVKAHTCAYSDKTGRKPPLQTDWEGDLRVITKVNLWRIDGKLHMCKHGGGTFVSYWDATDLRLTVVDEQHLQGEFTDYRAATPTKLTLHRPASPGKPGPTWACPYDEPPPADQPEPPHYFRDLMESEKERAHRP